MAHKKQIHNKKRPHFMSTEIALSQEDEAQLQQQLQSYQELAQTLRAAHTTEDANRAIEPLNALTEPAQIAFAKALAKEEALDAADLLQGIYEFGASKEARKEARRSLIRLETSQIVPQWNPPVVSPYSIVNEIIRASIPADFEPSQSEKRSPFADFFSGKMRRAADTGPLEEFDFSDLIADEVVEDFLEYWITGTFDKAYTMLAANSPLREDLTLERWAERRRAWTDQFHPRDLQLNEYSGLQTTMHKFVSLAAIQEKMNGEKQEGTASEEESQQAYQNEPESITLFWSLVLDGNAQSGSLPEFPVATLVNQESGRHWFWTTFICVEDGDSWHILDMVDQGARLQQTPTTALQAARGELTAHARAIMEAPSEASEEVEDDSDGYNGLEDIASGIGDLSRASNEVLYYDDILVTTGSADFDAFVEMYHDAIALSQFERSDVYSARMLEQFPDRRAAALRSQVALLFNSLESDLEEVESEKVQETFSRLESKERDLITLEPDQVSSYYHLIQTLQLMDNPDKEDEIRQLLEKAQPLATLPKDRAMVEVGFAQLEENQGNIAQALAGYKRAAEHDPDGAAIWYTLGQLQQKLAQTDEAVQSFLRSLELEPNKAITYAELLSIYRAQSKFEQAHELLNRGLPLFQGPDIPLTDVATMYAASALLAVEEGDLEKAEEHSQIAFESDMTLPIVHEAAKEVRQAQSRQRKAEREAQKQARSAQSKKRNKKR